MDRANYTDVIALAPDETYRDKVRLLLEGVESSPAEVPDPYYGGRDGFELVYQLLDQACEKLVNEL